MFLIVIVCLPGKSGANDMSPAHWGHPTWTLTLVQFALVTKDSAGVLFDIMTLPQVLRSFSFLHGGLVTNHISGSFHPLSQPFGHSVPALWQNDTGFRGWKLALIRIARIT